MAMTYSYVPRDDCPMCASTSQRVIGRRLNRHQGLRPRHLTGVASTVVRCNDCGLIFPNPLPLPSSIGDHYEKPPEDYWRPEYLTETFDAADCERKIRQFMPDVDDPKCLDVGAGLGHMMRAMLDRGFDIIGIEPSAPFVERAIQEGIPAERLRTATVEAAEFPAASFDFIALAVVLEHLEHPGQALERVLRWLRPGGLLFVEVPSADWLMATGLNIAYRVQGLDYVTNLSPMHDPYHLSEFTPRSFERHGARAGYRVVEHEHYVCNPFVPEPFARLARWVMERTHTGMNLAVWLTPS